MRDVPPTCRGCAFAPGAAAHEEPYNRLRSEVCALSAIPFFCHEGHNWRERELHRLTRVGFLRVKPRICGGWVRRVRELVAIGYFQRDRRLKRFTGALWLQLVEEFLTSSRWAKKATHIRMLRAMERYRRWLDEVGA